MIRLIIISNDNIFIFAYFTVAGFRDHTVYKGHQIFLYKRAQIFAADLWGAFKGQGYGDFEDISSITIFADYIVPAVLQQLGVLRYSSSVASIIKKNTEITSGSDEEVELRACSVYAVEQMKDLISKKTGKQVGLAHCYYIALRIFSDQIWCFITYTRLKVKFYKMSMYLLHV